MSSGFTCHVSTTFGFWLVGQLLCLVITGAHTRGANPQHYVWINLFENLHEVLFMVSCQTSDCHPAKFVYLQRPSPSPPPPLPPPPSPTPPHTSGLVENDKYSGMTGHRLSDKSYRQTTLHVGFEIALFKHNMDSLLLYGQLALWFENDA